MCVRSIKQHLLNGFFFPQNPPHVTEMCVVTTVNATTALLIDNNMKMIVSKKK